MYTNNHFCPSFYRGKSGGIGKLDDFFEVTALFGKAGTNLLFPSVSSLSPLSHCHYTKFTTD